MLKTAQISDCGRFRYRLGRDWSGVFGQRPSSPRVLLFVMLNPSTADDVEDDQTIRKCIAYAKAHDFNAISVVNLYAFRATEPGDLKIAGWPVGPANDENIMSEAMKSAGICLAWGVFASRTPRAGQVIKLLQRAAPDTPLQCLDVSKDGHPKHPLYLSGALRLKPFEVHHA